jgi:hypothetical protein
MKKRNIFYIAIVGVVVSLWIAYIWFALGNDFLQRYPTGSFNEIQYYKIEPVAILAFLEDNENILFQLESDSSFEKITEEPISWTQADYNKIAYKISEYVWSVSLDDWKLYRILFGANCSDNPTGFDRADYVYFNEIALNGKRAYTARGILITPQYGDITLGSDTNFPRPFLDWKYIQTDTVNVTAEEALQLAEGRGGEEARHSMQNKCQFSVSMNPEGYGHYDWRVSYSGNNPATEFTIIIPADK